MSRSIDCARQMELMNGVGGVGVGELLSSGGDSESVDGSDVPDAASDAGSDASESAASLGGVGGNGVGGNGVGVGNGGVGGKKKASLKPQTGDAAGTFKCQQCDKAFNRVCYLTQVRPQFCPWTRLVD